MKEQIEMIIDYFADQCMCSKHDIKVTFNLLKVTVTVQEGDQENEYHLRYMDVLQILVKAKR